MKISVILYNAKLETFLATWLAETCSNSLYIYFFF